MRNKLLKTILLGLLLPLLLTYPSLAATDGESYASTPHTTIDGVTCVPMSWLSLTYPDQDWDEVYTSDPNEKAQAVADGWYVLGDPVFFVSPVQLQGLVPLYRLYKPKDTDHYLTANWDDAQKAVSNYGFYIEGIVGYVAPKGSNIPGTIPLYEWYGTENTFHYYHVSEHESDWIGTFPRNFDGPEFNVFDGVGYSNTAPVIGPPGAPYNLSATAVSGNQIDLQWNNDSQRSAGIHIERSVGLGAFQQIASVGCSPAKYSDTTTSPNTIYFYRITNYNDWGDSVYSNTVIVTTPGTTPAPDPPSNLQVTSTSPAEVNLTWDISLSPNVTGYSVERATDAKSFGILSVFGKNTTAYTDTSITQGNTYTYRIRAWSGAKPSNPSNERAITIPRLSGNTGGSTSNPLHPILMNPGLTIPSSNNLIIGEFNPTLGISLLGHLPQTPGNLAAKPAGSYSVSLNWDKATGSVDGFKVERNDGSSYSEVADIPGSSMSYIDNGLKPGSTYSYRIKSYNGFDSSDYSNEVTVKTNNVMHINPIKNNTGQDSGQGSAQNPAQSQNQDHDQPANSKRKVEMVLGSLQYTVDGDLHNLDVPPSLIQNRTMLPVRALAEALGGTVEWQVNEKKATIKLGNYTIEAWLGKNKARVNGQEKSIDPTNDQVMPVIVGDRSLLPLRFIAENLGCQVQWIPEQSKVIIY